jgi:hypothetical protein
VFLAIANQISILVAPCNQLSNAKSQQDKEDDTQDYECTAKDGVILQGISLLAKIPAEWLGAISSIFIAIFTLTLWLATDRLWRISRIHAGHMERSVKAAQANAAAAQAAAEASLAQSVEMGKATEFAEKQMLIYGRQTDIIEKQHAVGRMQFIATHRPLLRVRYFRRIDISDQKVRINFTIINVGSSQANLLGSCGRLGFFAPGNLPPPFYEGAPPVIEPRKFEPGATDEGMILGTRDPNVHSTLHVYGYLVYEDIFNNTRTTAFCRRYNAFTHRFDVVDDSDYEYED